MVCYCCVKGCKNNTNLKKKDPNYTVSFHAFPTNPELRIKWLRAIGRPTWNPPSHTRICSVHFNQNQISYESCRTRIKDNSCPVNALPVNSNFEASDLEVCRICLATDVAMKNLQEGVLKSCMESISGLNDYRNIEGLPKFVCNECAAHLIRFYRLMEKSVIAQATLLDIFAQHSEITKNLIKSQDRKKLNLISSLNSYEQTNIYNYSYNYENGTSCLIKSECKYAINESKINIQLKEDYEDSTIKTNSYLEEENCHSNINAIDNTKHRKEVDLTFTAQSYSEKNLQKNELLDIGNERLNIHKEEEIEINGVDDESVWEDCIEETVVRDKRKKKKGCVKEDTQERKSKTKSVNGLTPDEVDMQDYFDIVKLSLQEQIDEWQKSVARRHLTSETTYRCEICNKVFAHINTYRMHTSNHDPRRGSAECPVCKLRFKNEVLVKSHRNRTHSKKFYCKTCPKVFNNVAVAKKHHRWHSGHVYTCTWCPFASAHESSARVHAATHAGAGATCAACGRACISARGLMLHCATAHRDAQETEGDPAFRCDECDINFVSEGARRVHLLTSSQHKKKPNLCDINPLDPSLKTTCSKCGDEFKSLKQLIEHTRSEHRRPPQKKTSWSLPGDSYPTQCELCGETVNNRKEHWWHVRKQHPKEKHTYQPVITAVCETCGKGFQVHTAATPYECTMCGKKFKYSTSVNLHVRTVHYKFPHPPRKKRGRAKNFNFDVNNENIS